VNQWDLIVIGAGAVGSAALRAAAVADARVLGLEQYTPANLRGSSHGHSRIFRHAYFEHPDYVPLLRHATARFESLERESGSRLLHRCGMLLMGGHGSAVVRDSIESAQRWSLPLDALDAAELRTRFPWFAVADDAIGAFEANAGLVRPEATVHCAIQVAVARGAELRTDYRADHVAEDDTGVSVVTEAGTERAAAVIIAAGPWAPLLMPELRPFLTVTRQVQAWVEPPSGNDASGMPCWLYDHGPGRRAMYGLAPDPAAPGSPDGSQSPSRYPKVACHGSDIVVDPDRGAAPVTAADTAAILAGYRKIAPALAGRVVESATCLYTMSPDEHFIVGSRPGCRRTFFAAGLSGHGFKLAPALGDALVDLALRGRTELPVDFLSADRFAAGRLSGGTRPPPG
jgi:sarcosine oxidase